MQVICRGSFFRVLADIAVKVCNLTCHRGLSSKGCCGLYQSRSTDEGWCRKADKVGSVEKACPGELKPRERI